MRLAVTVNNIHTECVDYTTTHLCMAATNRGHEVWYINVADFDLQPDDHTTAIAYGVPARQYRSAASYLNALWGPSARRERIPVDDLDLLWLRNDPSLDMLRRPWARMAGINFGRLARRRGVIVLNDPDAMAVGLNKLYLQYFPEEVRPRTLISRDRELLKAFIAEQGGTAVLKPLAGSGGRNVFLVQPADAPNVNQMIEAVSRDNYVIAQEYLPQAADGDTRLFMMNGEVLRAEGHVAAIHRRRGEGDPDMRSNMTAGARAVKAEVSDEMLELAEVVRPKLVEDGMFFVGLDIVGDRLMEINVQSPGGLQSADELEGVRFCRVVIEALERKVDYARHYGRRFDNIELATL